MDIKITKKSIIDSGEDTPYSMAYNYYLVYGKIYNDDFTRYRTFKFCLKIWKDDIFEFEGYPETMTAKRQKEITEDMIYSFIDCNFPKSYIDCKAFFDACRDTIEQYNRTVRI